MAENYIVPKALMIRIDKALQEIRKQKTEYINREEVCKLFDWSPKTLSNNLANGKITPDMYTVGVNGLQFFDKAKLLGLT
jgi:hypothetical protein